MMMHTSYSGKRATDLLLASLAIVILSPLLLAVAVLVRALLGKPVLFRQSRPGLRGSLFACLKFRTMKDTRDLAGNLLPDADRLTRTGSFLRRTSLDELPELWNVLRGDMSLVGPRPLLPQYLPRFNAFQQQRHQVKPGITGWAQVNGRNALTWEQKFELDVWYVDHQSLALDLKILWLTLPIVLGHQGIEHGSHATMPEFLGSIERSAKP
jgi:sugar transferase EpsL